MKGLKLATAALIVAALSANTITPSLAQEDAAEAAGKEGAAKKQVLVFPEQGGSIGPGGVELELVKTGEEDGVDKFSVIQRGPTGEAILNTPGSSIVLPPSKKRQAPQAPDTTQQQQQQPPKPDADTPGPTVQQIGQQDPNTKGGAPKGSDNESEEDADLTPGGKPPTREGMPNNAKSEDSKSQTPPSKSKTPPSSTSATKKKDEKDGAFSTYTGALSKTLTVTLIVLSATVLFV